MARQPGEPQHELARSLQDAPDIRVDEARLLQHRLARTLVALHPDILLQHDKGERRRNGRDRNEQHRGARAG